MKLQLCLIIGLASASAVHCAKQQLTTEELATLIEQSLPVGTSADRAVAFLDSLGFQTAPLTGKDTKVRAIKRRVRQQGVTTTSVQVTIYLDGKRQVIDHEVREVYTGP